MKEKRFIKDATLIGKWDEVTDLQLSTITKRDTDTAKLDGLVLRGYETKFGVTNENGERYAPGCLDKFIEDYYTNNRLNMVVDVQHSDAIDDQVGRVIYLETNSVGFYFVVYIPRRVARYEQIKALLEEGILQGFSKYGYATDYEWKYKDGEVDYFLIKEMKLLSVSLVTAPANAVAFESMGEAVRNELTYRNRIKEAAKNNITNTKKQLLKKH